MDFDIGPPGQHWFIHSNNGGHCIVSGFNIKAFDAFIAHSFQNPGLHPGLKEAVDLQMDLSYFLKLHKLDGSSAELVKCWIGLVQQWSLDVPARYRGGRARTIRRRRAFAPATREKNR